MALVLSFKVGQDFFIGTTRFVVNRIVTDVDFVVTRQQDGVQFEIGDLQAVEVMPDVFLSAGDSQQMHAIKIVIDAPHDVIVLRGDRYRKPTSHAKVPV